MQHIGLKNPNADLAKLGLSELGKVYWNTSPEELTELSVQLGEGEVADSGALVINTGKYTGRAPKDKFIVKDAITENAVHWNDFNQPIAPEYFDKLQTRLTEYLKGKDVYVRDAYACAHPDYQMSLRVIGEKPWQSLFCYNMFLRPSEEQIQTIEPEWIVINAPGCSADPATDGTRQDNFAVVNFTKKMILVGGTAYTGEIKKGIFTILNFILPHEKDVLAMHCSANVGADGDTAVFFGLSGTGKTTLSADPTRGLIGDDEHGWSKDSIFNFEGGCYAKTINLSAEKEPQIYAAVRPGALSEYFSKFLLNLLASSLAFLS